MKNLIDWFNYLLPTTFKNYFTYLTYLPIVFKIMIMSKYLFLLSMIEWIYLIELKRSQFI